ncbi:MAG TPA: HlyD family efflux transporter periplasmic adaptor subunit [Candidatus Acidoferrum sp.]|nr:HlyD family efflux transporter periplasmic adaptor subunit [Candidatus Acidoferrum sp.]
MRNKLKVLIPVVILALLAFGISRVWNRQSESTARLALGTLERDRVTLAATAGEIITAQPIAQGSHVKAGDLLVQLDTTLELATIHKLESDIAQQEANLLKLRNGARKEELRSAVAHVDTARTELAESERDLKRLVPLAAKQMVPQSQADTAQSLRDSNVSKLQDAEAQLALMRAGTRSEDLQQAEALLASTKALLVVEQQKLGYLSVTATVTGTLDSLPWKTGERVALGAQVAILLADGAPYARVYIPETSRAVVNMGSELDVHVDGVSQSFRGKVRWIARDPAFTPYYALNGSERSRLVYLAEVQLADAARDLPSGLPAQVALP